MLNVLEKHLANAWRAFLFSDDLPNQTGLYAPARFLTGTFGMTAFGREDVFPEKRAHLFAPA
jgi:hypothetical protein